MRTYILKQLQTVPAIIGIIFIGFFVAAFLVSANWTAPLAKPPTCTAGNPGCDPPVNTSGAGQVKTGGLTVAALPVAGGIGFTVLNGNVGIGTPSPTAKLQVMGSIHTGGGAGVSTPIEVGGAGSGNHYAYIDFRGDDTYTDYGLRILRGNTGPDTSSQIAHRGNGSLFFITQEAADMRFRTTSSDRLVIKADGNVGIGTLSPTEKLHVNGNITATKVFNPVYAE